MHCYALEYLHDRLLTSKRVLDVGSGTGYLTLAFALMMEDCTSVSYGIEHIGELVSGSIANINK